MAEANIAGRDAPGEKWLLDGARRCVLCWIELEMMSTPCCAAMSESVGLDDGAQRRKGEEEGC